MEQCKLILLATFCAIFSIHSTAGGTGVADYNGIGGRIINGTEASADDTKHQVSIRRRSTDQYYFGSGHLCGGSLIERNVVLTAAHCFVNQEFNNGTYRPASDYIIVMGNLNRYVRTDTTLQFDIDEIVYGIEIFNLNTYENDIAVVFLDGSVPTNYTNIDVIEIAREPVAAGTVCQATGWGLTEEGYNSAVLMTVDLPIIDFDVCVSESNYAAGLLRDGMLCAGYMEGEKDACTGDSGGPLACNQQVAGLVSWGKGCAQALYPGVYTDVEYWSSWIDNAIESYNAEASSSTESSSSTEAGSSTESSSSTEAGNSTESGNTTETDSSTESDNSTEGGNTTESGNSTESGNTTESGNGSGEGGGGAMSNFSHSAKLLVVVTAWTILMTCFN